MKYNIEQFLEHNTEQTLEHNMEQNLDMGQADERITEQESQSELIDVKEKIQLLSYLPRGISAVMSMLSQFISFENKISSTSTCKWDIKNNIRPSLQVRMMVDEIITIKMYM